MSVFETLKPQAVSAIEMVGVGGIQGGLIGSVAKSREDSDFLVSLHNLGVISDPTKINLRHSDALKRTQYYSTKKHITQLQNGHIGAMPPLYGGPPVASRRMNANQWSRLDPSEILVHNVKCQDQLDDIIEDRMREEFARQIIQKVG